MERIVVEFGLLEAMSVFLILVALSLLVFAFLGSFKGPQLKKEIAYLWKENERLQNQTAMFQSLQLVGKNFNSILDKKDLLKTILDSFIKMARCEIGFLVLYNYSSNEYEYQIGYGMDKSMLERKSFLPQGDIFRRLAERREGLITPKSKEIGKDTFFCFKKERSILLGNADTLFSIPLISEDRILGIVNLYCSQDKANSLKDNMALFSILANQASAALANATFHEFAILDRLTLAYNREYLKRRLEEEVERCRRYQLNMGLLMVDIDHFKLINDNYGHQKGDLILKSLVKIIKSNIRSIDSCARYGGEEFIVLFPQTGLKESVEKAEYLRKTIQSHSFLLDKNLSLTVSIGVATWRWPQDKDLDGQTLIRQADMYMYCAKAQGKNKVCFREDKK